MRTASDLLLDTTASTFGMRVLRGCILGVWTDRHAVQGIGPRGRLRLCGCSICGLQYPSDPWDGFGARRTCARPHKCSLAHPLGLLIVRVVWRRSGCVEGGLAVAACISGRAWVEARPSGGDTGPLPPPPLPPVIHMNAIINHGLSPICRKSDWLHRCPMDPASRVCRRQGTRGSGAPSVLFSRPTRCRDGGGRRCGNGMSLRWVQQKLDLDSVILCTTTECGSSLHQNTYHQLHYTQSSNSHTNLCK